MPDMLPAEVDPSDVSAIRRFNRFYTRLAGALDEGHLHSAFSLAEVRVLYEIAHRDRPSASGIARDLGLDAGYLSRLLRKLDDQALVERVPSAEDGRLSELRLTTTGTAEFATLQRRAEADVATLLAPVPVPERQRLRTAMRTIEAVLSGPAAQPPVPYLIRSHRAGDIGWMISRHGALYAAEYQWDATFEALAAKIAGAFLEHFDSSCEHCWIAERDGVNVGSVFVVKHPDRPGVAKLRMLLVEPSARGLGIGRRLVDECLNFARTHAYHTMSLWTNSILHSARKIYVDAGFQLVHEAPHRSFGADLVEQVWERAL
jgi:DNA-binding MarR family transcriptional regulator/GNAT superfamily N-acetyltransferase